MNGNFLREVNFLGDGYLQLKKSTLFIYLFIYFAFWKFLWFGNVSRTKKKLKFLGL